MSKRKWVAGVLSTAVVTSMLVFPGFSAAQGKINLADQLEKANRYKLIQQLETVSKQFPTNRAGKSTVAKRAAIKAAVTSVTFEDKLNSYQAHVYHFETGTDGKVTVDSNSSSADVAYEIVPVLDPTAPPPNTPMIYHNGDPLPKGKYEFVVHGNPSSQPKDTKMDYKFKVDAGVEITKYDNKVPNVDLSNPTKHQLRLPKGSKSYKLDGTTTGDEAVVIDIMKDETVPVKIKKDGSFSQDVPLNLGYNFESFAVHNKTSENFVVEDFFYTVPGVKRIAGKDRFEVSANLSKENYPHGTDTVVIARGDLYTDALSGGALASWNRAPILLTSTNSLPASIRAEITRLKASHAIILGGTGSVSKNVEDQLKQMGLTTERYAGKNRFDVSAQIATTISQIFQTDTAIVASGLNFPDALSASSPSGQMLMPILLVGTNSVPAEIQTFLKKNKNVKNFIIVGGPATVSTAVQKKLQSYGHVDRVSGKNRFEVGVNLIKYFSDPSATQSNPELAFANGLNFPDALSGGPFAANQGAPILLTQPTKLDPSVNNFLDHNNNDAIYIFGGTASVSTSVEKKLDSKIK